MDDKTINNLYTAYFTSKMTPQEEVDYETDVNSGLISMPKAGQLKSQLIPFDANIHTTRKGTPTENITTEISPDGQAWNIPLIWYDKSGNPKTLNNMDALRQAQKYELINNMFFPRFPTVSRGITAAAQRNNSRGIPYTPLAIPTKETLLNPAGLTKEDVINPAGLTKENVINPLGVTKKDIINPLGITKENVTNPLGLTKENVVNPLGITKEDIKNPLGIVSSSKSIAKKLGF